MPSSHDTQPVPPKALILVSASRVPYIVQEPNSSNMFLMLIWGYFPWRHRKSEFCWGELPSNTVTSQIATRTMARVHAKCKVLALQSDLLHWKEEGNSYSRL